VRRKPAHPGLLPRFYWQPSSALRAQGHVPQRLPNDRRGIVDVDTLTTRAIAEATQINRWLDMKHAAEGEEREMRQSEGLHSINALIRLYCKSEFWQPLRPASKAPSWLFLANVKLLIRRLGRMPQPQIVI